MPGFTELREGVLIFPDQLYDSHPALTQNRTVFFLEEAAETPAGRYRRICGKGWLARLEERGFSVERIQTGRNGFSPTLREALAARGAGTLHVADPVNLEAEERLRSFCRENGVHLVLHETPAFLMSRDWLEDFFERQRTCRMAAFYRTVRRENGLLLDARGKPLGGKWSFDPQNRRRLPKGMSIPRARGNENPQESLRFPTSRKEAEAALFDFLEKRLDRFGDFEDAMALKEPVLFHSLLSPVLNVGLLTPAEVLEAVLLRHAERPVPLNSLEGFVRQVCGWREFVRAMYRKIGARQRSANALGHSAPLPAGFTAGQTGMPPVDAVVARVNLHGYAHHIERLMVLGNFLLLCETDPAAVTAWFMSRFTDATDWAMVPNVFGMSQFADGGLMTTKPYCSGSAYLLRMGDFPEGPWRADWDALFWRFVSQHRDLFSRNPRTRFLVSQLERFSETRRSEMMSRAETLLKQFHESLQKTGQ
jgi:deoxyribodipyrimidine photolyase-related protein